MSKEKCVNFEIALTDNEIISYAQIVDKFLNTEIDYVGLEDMFSSYGVTVEPALRDFPNIPMTREEADKVKERLMSKKYNYNDIDSFVLSSKDFKNVDFNLSGKAVKLLADYGMPEYQDTMIQILKTQLQHDSSKVDEVSEARRNKLKRQIAEYELRLQKTENTNKTK